MEILTSAITYSNGPFPDHAKTVDDFKVYFNQCSVFHIRRIFVYVNRMLFDFRITLALENSSLK